MYLYYLAAWLFSSSKTDGGSRVLSGRGGARATLFGYAAAVMTLSKTILYCKKKRMNLDVFISIDTTCYKTRTDKEPIGKYTGANEYYSGFDNIGHNPLNDLILLWIIPKCVHLSAF